MTPHRESPAGQDGATSTPNEGSPKSNSRIAQRHLEMLAASGITPEHAERRGYMTCGAAARYDEAAKRFVSAAKATDVEASGENLVTANASQRQAWLAAPELAGLLDEALRPLLAAATLCGQRPDVAYLTAATDVATTEYQIALACDPGKAHRRKVWLAWEKTEGRTGRWAALNALGVRIRAADDPEVTPYRRPEKPIAVASPSGRVEWHDPHDGPLKRGWGPVQVGWFGEKPATNVP